MPRFSRFAPLGLLRFSRRKPDAAAIYEASAANLGGQFSLEEGGYVEATLHAQALGMARVRRRLRAAAEQRLPSRVSCLLPVREDELGIVPGPFDTMAERRAVLASRFLAARGGTKLNIQAALTELLGADFLAYVPTPTADAEVYPPTLPSTAVHFARPGVARRALRIIGPIVGGTGTYSYETIQQPQDALTPEAIDPVVGDVFVLSAGQVGIEEAVTIDGVDTTARTVTFTSVRPHGIGSVAFTHPYPAWRSTKRHSLVVLSASAAADPEKRRKVNELMQRMARTVSTWDICAGSGSSTTGPFTVGGGLLGITTIGAVSF